MTRPSIETDPFVRQRNTGCASAYSARIQEAMRFDRLRSSDYVLVMTLFDAVLQGYTEERWQEEHQHTVAMLRQQPPDPNMSHTDEVNRYTQTVNCLKDLLLWPW